MVELFAWANAIMSAILEASEACKLNAEMLSVTACDASARSIPDAAANCRTPSIPASDWSTDQPASDMFVNADAASDAENFVEFPSSFAFFVSASSCDPVAPEIAATSLIPASKELPTSTAYSAASFAASSTALTPPTIASDVRSAFSISPKVEVFFEASSRSSVMSLT